MANVKTVNRKGIEMKRILTFFLISILVLNCCACSQKTATSLNKLQIVATLFPQYDFVREIAGDKADITLLAPAGADGHTYEPTTAEIIKITESDMFIYTGKHMEAWADRIISSVDSKNLKIVDVSENIDLKFEKSHHTKYEHAYDPHIWTEHNNAKTMVDNIANALCDVDSNNADYYKSRATDYKNQLDELDKSFINTVSAARNKKIVFGDSFAFLYFTERYGLDHKAAFDSCSSEAEQSALIITQIISELKKDSIPAIYYSETSNRKVPEAIAQETGAMPLLFHSCHTVTKEEIDNGATYLTLMKQNLENLEKGLN
ncbi:MAG: zinc ABC transporter substrate-binding protein [Clostridia bacterium]|nr:zinc ABC transporter substrate-binding protein [Clostridia bacterium]